jgi:hypothetical protein
MHWAFIVWTCLAYMEPQCTVKKQYWATEELCGKAKDRYVEKLIKDKPRAKIVYFCKEQL